MNLIRDKMAEAQVRQPPPPPQAAQPAQPAQPPPEAQPQPQPGQQVPQEPPQSPPGEEDPRPGGVNPIAAALAQEQEPDADAELRDPMEDDDDTIGGGFSDSQNATAAEQEDKDALVDLAMSYLFDKKGQPAKNAVKFLESQDDNPAGAIADFTTLVISEVDKKFKGAIPQDVIVAGSVEFMTQVAELAKASRVFPVDEATQNVAGQLLLNNLGNEYGGDPEEIRKMLQDFSPEKINEIRTAQDNFGRKVPTKAMTAGRAA